MDNIDETVQKIIAERNEEHDDDVGQSIAVDCGQGTEKNASRSGEEDG